MRILVLDAGPLDGAATSMTEALRLRHEVETFPYSRWNAPWHYGHGPSKVARRAATVGLMVASKVAGTPRTVLGDRALLRFVKGKRFDFVLILRISKVPADVVREVKERTGAVVVGWFMDAIVNLGAAGFVHAPYDRVFFKDKVIVDRFRSRLASPVYDFLPDGFNPENHRPVPVPAPTAADAPDVITYGNGYPYRARLLAPLLAAPDVSVRIHGSVQRATVGALRAVYAPPVLAKEKSAALRAAKIALNTNHFGELGGVNKRTFEVCGAGAFQLTDGPAIADYFEPGKEVATFTGPDDLVERVRWYKTHPDERRAVEDAGLRRAWREHTYHHRLNELFAKTPGLEGAEPLPVPVEAPAPDGAVRYR